MASEVEVLRELLAARHGGGWCSDAQCAEVVALQHAISALEAREAQPTEAEIELERQYVKHGIIDPPRAQPKVEGRMGEELVTYLEMEGRRAGMGVRESADAIAEMRRARASEAALKEEARHWEARWLQEKMEHKKTQEENAKLRRSYVPQGIAMDCLAALAPLDKPGEPNTLWALVHKAMATIGALSKRVEELERLAQSRADEIIRLSECAGCKTPMEANYCEECS